VRLALVALLLVFLGCQSVEAPPEGPQWGTPKLMENRPADAIRPQIAIDAMGNAVAVWDQSNTPGSDSDDIWARRRDAQGEWGAAVLLEENEPGDCFGAQIGIGADGSAVLVFLQEPQDQDEETHFSIWAVRHTPSGGWEPAECIQSDDPECAESNAVGDAGQPQVAVDPRGDAVVVWTQFDADDESLSIWSNRFTTGDGWSGAGPVESDINDLVVPQVAMDANGYAIAVWERVDNNDGRSDVWSKRQTPTGDWVGSQPVEVNDSGNAWFPQVGADPEGNAIAVWQQQTDGTRFDIWSNRYLASTQKWGDAERIEHEDAGDAEKPQVAMDGNGNAIAVWVQSGGDRPGIWSNRHTPNAGWGDATPIGPSHLVSARAPQVAADPEGNAVAIWVQFDFIQDSVWSNRYMANRGWGKSQPIESDDKFGVQGPQVAVDFEGNAVAVWSQKNDDFEFDLWSNHLEAQLEDVAAGSGQLLGFLDWARNEYAVRTRAQQNVDSRHAVGATAVHSHDAL
jgi:hypothetical protein